MANIGDDYIELTGWVDSEKPLEDQAWNGEGGKGLEPGEYDFEIVSVKKTLSSKQNPQLEVTSKVTSEGPAFDKTNKTWYSLTQKAIGRLLNLFVAVGQPLDENMGFSPQALIGGNYHGTVVAEETVTGKNPVTDDPITKTYTRVQNELPIPEPVAPTPPPAAKGKAANSAQAKPAATQPRK